MQPRNIRCHSQPGAASPAGEPAHSHPHAHARAHEPPPGSTRRRLSLAMAITAGFMVVEVVGGIVSGSLALLADAGHMFTDVGALALAWFSVRIGERPPDARHGYGHRRFEVLAAFTNGVVLFLLSGWIVFEAARRLLDPPQVLSGTMLMVAVAGLCVNLASFAILRGGRHVHEAHDHDGRPLEGEQEDLAIAGAVVHVLGDLLGSVAAIAAALVIRYTGWMPIDPLLSVFIALLIVRSAWFVVYRSSHILLEGTPEHLDAEVIHERLRDVAGVEDTHHLHTWSLTTGEVLATLHVRLRAGAEAREVIPRVRERLRRDFGIGHATIEVDYRDAAGPT